MEFGPTNGFPNFFLPWYFLGFPRDQVWGWRARRGLYYYRSPTSFAGVLLQYAGNSRKWGCTRTAGGPLRFSRRSYFFVFFYRGVIRIYFLSCRTSVCAPLHFLLVARWLHDLSTYCFGMIAVDLLSDTTTVESSLRLCPTLTVVS